MKEYAICKSKEKIDSLFLGGNELILRNECYPIMSQAFKFLSGSENKVSTNTDANDLKTDIINDGDIPFQY